MDFDSVTLSTHWDDDISLLDISVPSSHSGNTKITACIITFFPDNEDRDMLLPQTWFKDGDYINYCAKFELGCETERFHGHIFVRFTNNGRKRFDQLRKLIQDVSGKPGNIQVSKKSTRNALQCAINYVLKPDGAVGLPFIWNESCHFDEQVWLNKPKQKQTKEDLERKRIDWIESKPKSWTWEQIVHETEESKYLLASCSWGKSYHAGRMATVERRTITDVIIMYGAGGTGKTTMARDYKATEIPDEFERYYKRNHEDGHFWGGGRVQYKGQSIIHFEEFDGNERFSNMKEWCDIGKTGPPVNVKNGGTHLNHSTVLITSNVHPAGWYHDMWTKDPKQFHPFWRRITKVLFFPAHRPDGSLNIPDATNPPFFVDQSDDWINFKGDFTACKQHANEHWPLQDPGITDDRGNRASFFPWP